MSSIGNRGFLANRHNGFAIWQLHFALILLNVLMTRLQSKLTDRQAAPICISTSVL